MVCVCKRLLSTHPELGLPSDWLLKHAQIMSQLWPFLSASSVRITVFLLPFTLACLLVSWYYAPIKRQGYRGIITLSTNLMVKRPLVKLSAEGLLGGLSPVSESWVRHLISSYSAPLWNFYHSQQLQLAPQHFRLLSAGTNLCTKLYMVIYPHISGNASMRTQERMKKFKN